MDRAPPPHARRPIVPLAAVTLVVAAPPRSRMQAPAVAIGFFLALAAVAFNSPLIDELRLPDEGAWRFLGVVAEAGCVMAALGMLFRIPGLAWSGAGGFFAISLCMAQMVWPAHLVSLVLLAVVAAWYAEHHRLEADRRRSMPPPYPAYPAYPAYPQGWAPVSG